LVLEVELQDQTASAEWTFNGKPIVPNERLAAFLEEKLLKLKSG
jgi:hypothetical protein